MNTLASSGYRQYTPIPYRLLCNCNGTEAVAQWCRDHVTLLRRLFGSRLFLTPSGSLYRRLLPQLKAQAIEQVLGTWIQATLVAHFGIITH